MLKSDEPAGTAKIYCDSCPAAMDSVTDIKPKAAMDRAVHLAKIARWSIERHAGRWQHFCPHCRQSRNRGALL